MPIYAAVAYAAAPEGQKSVASSQKSGEQQRTETSADRFEKALDAIRENVSKAGEKADKGEGNAKELETIKAKRAEIESADIEFKKELADTEKKLKDAKLPQEILDRHYKFVKHYDDNLTELKTNLDDIEKQKSDSRQLSAALTKTKAHLDKTKAPSKHVPLDPNNLPHRTVKAKEKAPRLKKEDFEKDFPPQKKATKLASLQAISATDSLGWTRILNSAFRNPNSALLGKPILVASNGSLAGLLSSESNLPRPLGERIEVRGGFDSVSFAVNDFIPNSELNTTNYQVAQVSVDPPTAAEIAETVEVQFTPEIKAKAQELGYNPVKIYEWVRNNVEFVPTYGSIQGANMCLQAKQCNDFDTASLLIALLRASNISAHYVYGTIEVPIDKVMNWVGGFTDPNAALQLIASGGIPVTALIAGGTISTVRMEHVWVEAWIDYIPSRGAVQKQGDTWIPLDAVDSHIIPA
jgi:hypothetical protein